MTRVPFSQRLARRRRRADVQGHQGDQMANRLEGGLGVGEAGHLGGQAATGHDVDDMVALAQFRVAGAEAPDVDGQAARPHLGGEQVGGADDAVGAVHVVHEEDDSPQPSVLGGILKVRRTCSTRGAVAALGADGHSVGAAGPVGTTGTASATGARRDTGARRVSSALSNTHARRVSSALRGLGAIRDHDPTLGDWLSARFDPIQPDSPQSGLGFGHPGSRLHT